jgi:hypothetical protein
LAAEDAMTLRLLPKPAAKPDTSKRRPAQVVLGVVDAGASPAGSTYWKTMRRCPREHALRHVAGLRRSSGASEALTVGWLFHLALEAYYRSLLTDADGVSDEGAAWAAIKKLEGEGGYEETYPEVERLLAGYFETYRRQDAWRVVAVEETLASVDDGLHYSARLDLVIEEAGRLWIVEHKTARAITPDLLSGYQMDMQIMGQVWLFGRCVDLSVYPPLAGVKINIATKTKVPKYERVEVYPSRQHLAAFEESMRQWSALEGAFAGLGWPKALGNCTGPSRYFGQCDYFDVCHGRPEANVGMISAEDPPFGFTRDETSEHEGDDR